MSEADVRKKVPQQHVWDDSEEPVTCVTDAFVSEMLRYEVKQTFPDPGEITAAYGADLAEMIGSPSMSKHSDSSKRSNRKKRAGKKSLKSSLTKL